METYSAGSELGVCVLIALPAVFAALWVLLARFMDKPKRWEPPLLALLLTLCVWYAVAMVIPEPLTY